MESGQPLYDARNSVTLGRPGKRNLERRREMVAGSRDNPLKLMKYERKVAMSNVCRFCGNALKTARAICPLCITCQYCGLVPSGSRICEFCGNEDLDKKKNPRKRRIVRGPHRPQDERKKPKRNVRRIGPQRRDRPGQIKRRST
jgi:hypothetical protein